MKARLKGWGWAATGAVGVLALLWLGTTIYTFLKERQDASRITHIEKVIIHTQQRHNRNHATEEVKGVVAGSGIHHHPHGQSAPGSKPGAKTTTTEPAPAPQQAPAAPSSPAPTPGPVPHTTSAGPIGDLPAPPPLSATIAPGTSCPVNALSVHVCTE